MLFIECVHGYTCVSIWYEAHLLRNDIFTVMVTQIHFTVPILGFDSYINTIHLH